MRTEDLLPDRRRRHILRQGFSSVGQVTPFPDKDFVLDRCLRIRFDTSAISATAMAIMILILIPMPPPPLCSALLASWLLGWSWRGKRLASFGNRVNRFLSGGRHLVVLVLVLVFVLVLLPGWMTLGRSVHTCIHPG